MSPLFLRDTPLTSLPELIFKAGGPYFHLDGLPESYLSGEFDNIVSMKVFTSLPMTLRFTNENGVWTITPRGEPRAAAPRFVSLEDVAQGRAQLPVIYGMPRRAAAIVLGTKPLALLETGHPPSSQRQLVAEGDLVGGLRVGPLSREGVVLHDGPRRFLVPLVPLAPKP